LSGKQSETVSPVMRQLADYIAAALRRPLPAAVAEKTRHHLLDTVAAMISGAKLPPGKMRPRSQAAGS
jgi:2-methylcitrate dehydratase PrpD